MKHLVVGATNSYKTQYLIDKYILFQPSKIKTLFLTSEENVFHLKQRVEKRAENLNISLEDKLIEFDEFYESLIDSEEFMERARRYDLIIIDILPHFNSNKQNIWHIFQWNKNIVIAMQMIKCKLEEEIYLKNCSLESYFDTSVYLIKDEKNALKIVKGKNRTGEI